MTDTPHTYPDSYFMGRGLNDSKRLESQICAKARIVH